MDALHFPDDDLLVHSVAKPTDGVIKGEWLTQFLDCSDALHAAEIWINASNIKSIEEFKHSIVTTIDQLDEKLNNQLNEIIHHDQFQQIEAGWIGAKYLVDQVSKDSNEAVKIKLLSVTWSEVSKDALRSIEFDQSHLFKSMYSNEFGLAGGEPFGLMIGNYSVAQSKPGSKFGRDVMVTTKIAQIAAAAFCPFIMSCEPKVFGVDRYHELATTMDISSQFEQPEYQSWNSLRKSDESRFLGFTLPKALFRQPYARNGKRREAFQFRENISNSETELLWGNAAFVFASVVLKAFQTHGWFTHIRGIKRGELTQGVTHLPVKEESPWKGNNKRQRSGVNLQVTERKEMTLSDLGFIPMTSLNETSMVCFSSNMSFHHPDQYERQDVTLNARLSSMLQYTLCVSRIAHYIKVMARDRIGGYENAESLQRDFQMWLHQYSTSSDEASDELRAKYPLNEATIQVKEKRDNPGHFYSILHLRPHFQLDQMVSSIKLVTELTSEQRI